MGPEPARRAVVRAVRPDASALFDLSRLRDEGNEPDVAAALSSSSHHLGGVSLVKNASRYRRFEHHQRGKQWTAASRP